MALEQKLSLRLSQRLVMTPALQQAIKLLQMSTLELREEIATELEQNPALEESNDGTGTDGEAALNGVDDETPDQPQSAEESEIRDALSEVDVDYLLENYFDSGPAPPRGMQEVIEAQPGWEANLSTPDGLEALLLRQLTLSTSDPEILEIGRAIIGNLDAFGYLQASIDEIVTMGDYRQDRVEEALALIQSLDPPGVGARSLQECLSIQIRLRGLGSSPAAAIVAHHLDLLQAHRYADLAAALGITLEELKRHLEFLRTLDARPGERVSPPPTSAIEPDVVVVKTEEGYRVVLNDDGYPRLRVSRYVRDILRRGSGASPEDREFARGKVNAAVRLIKSIDERQKTIYRVACSIVEQQIPFFDGGLGALHPMVLRDVAGDIGVHESTVSRVVNHKYMHTPHGVFEMRFFFHSGLSTGAGEDVSSVTIKERIRKMIAEEDTSTPFSDSALAARLNAEGDLSIARRTVAKYREELRILPSTQRRRALLPG